MASFLTFSQLNPIVQIKSDHACCIGTVCLVWAISAHTMVPGSAANCLQGSNSLQSTYAHAYSLLRSMRLKHMLNVKRALNFFAEQESKFVPCLPGYTQQEHKTVLVLVKKFC